MPTLSDILNSKIGKDRLSKTYVAEKMEVSEKTIENYINGKREPKGERLIKLSKVVGFSLSELAERGTVFEQKVPKQERPKTENYVLPPGESKRTLDDYIKKIEEHNRFLQNVITNGLLTINQSLQANFDRLHEGQALQEAGHKGWVRVAARLFSGGNKAKENDLLDEMGNIFADVTRPDASSYTVDENS